MRIENGQIVKVSSRIGTIEMPREISEKIMPGVVPIPHGYGHGRSGVKLDTATKHAGASINDLTDDRVLDDLTGNARVRLDLKSSAERTEKIDRDKGDGQG